MSIISDIGGLLGGIFGETNAQPEERNIDDILQKVLMSYNLDPAIGRYAGRPDLQNQLSGIKADPLTVQAQNNALTGLGNVAQGGWGVQDEAALGRLNNAASQEIGGQNAALRSMMERRQLGNSGDALRQLSAGANQAGANAYSQYGSNVVGDARNRALQAMMAQGQLGSQMRGQSFGEQAQIGNAGNQINQFNSEMANRIAQNNINRQQQEFENATSVARNRAGAWNNMADQSLRRAGQARLQGEGYGKQIGGTVEDIIKLIAGGGGGGGGGGGFI